MTSARRHYENEEADSARWDAFEFRPGDIVISTPLKSGTTWTQLLVALLVFDGSHFPASLGRLSPWLDLKLSPVEDTCAFLETLTHRRFIKTHTPLDGLPVRSDIRYVCVGRDPRDTIISMMHHKDNLDRERIGELSGKPLPDPVNLSLEQNIDQFIDGLDESGWNLTSVAHHYSTFWARRHDPNVALFHFSAYLSNLPRELQRLAAHLELPLRPERALELAKQASIDVSRTQAAQIAPDAHLQVWKDPVRFFRAGSRGEGRQRMTAEQQQRYDARLTQLVPKELAQWMHEGPLD